MNRRSFLAAMGAGVTTQRLARFKADSAGLTTTRHPYVQNVADDRATIIWATQESGLGEVQYSVDGINFRGAFGRSRLFTRAETGLTANFVQFQAELKGLTADTEYLYRVVVNGEAVSAAGEQRFRTAGAGNFNFLVLGDSGEGTEHQYLIAQKMYAERAALVVHTGDLVYPFGSQDNYQRYYLNYYSATMSSVPFFPTLGNHDYDRGETSCLAIHSVPTDNVPASDRGKYYSFDWGNVHFVSLDAHLSLEQAVTADGAMLEWLDNDLRSTKQFWRVVYFHYPPYAAGPNENDIHSAWVRQYVVPILERHGAQLVLSGHEHSYQRSQPIRKSSFVPSDAGTTYLVSGGGGSLLYPVHSKPIVAAGRSDHHYLRAEVRGMQMKIRAILYDGTEFDSVTLIPRPMFADEDGGPPPITFEPAPTAGALVRIVGRALAAGEVLSCTPEPATELAGTIVTINDRPIQLLYVSGNQIVGQMPFSVDGNITVRVITPNGFSDMSVNPG